VILFAALLSPSSSPSSRNSDVRRPPGDARGNRDQRRQASDAECQPRRQAQGLLTQLTTNMAVWSLGRMEVAATVGCCQHCAELQSQPLEYVFSSFFSPARAGCTRVVPTPARSLSRSRESRELAANRGTGHAEGSGESTGITKLSTQRKGCQ